MSKHTPGPWSIPHFARPDVNCECKFVLADSMMGAVCSVYVSGEGDDWISHGDNPRFDEAVANASLIAAAPDLLEELENCADLMDMCFSNAPVDSCIGVALIKAKAAISKATGETA